MEYGHARAVADGVNVDYQVYRINTRITEAGNTVEKWEWVDRRDRLTRGIRWEQLEDDLTYQSGQLDRDVVAPGQIRTVVRAGSRNPLLLTRSPMLYCSWVGRNQPKDNDVAVMEAEENVLA